MEGAKKTPQAPKRYIGGSLGHEREGYVGYCPANRPLKMKNNNQR